MLRSFSENPDIRPILDGCLVGDKSSWNLFLDHFHRLISGLVHKEHYGTEYEDLIQHVYLKLVENDYRLIRQFDGDHYASFLIYLSEIVRFILKNENRKEVRKNKREIVSSPEDFELLEAPLDSYQRENEDEFVEFLMTNLESPFREILLFKLRGYKSREIASILNLPLNTVLTRSKRAIDKLKKMKEQGIFLR
jgi:RNA polymerase sigma factor (sigma-70 family)